MTTDTAQSELSYEGVRDGVVYCYSREGRGLATEALRFSGVGTNRGKDGSWYHYLRADPVLGLPGMIRVQMTYEQVLRFREFFASEVPTRGLDHIGCESYGDCFEQDLLR